MQVIVDPVSSTKCLPGGYIADNHAIIPYRGCASVAERARGQISELAILPDVRPLLSTTNDDVTIIHVYEAASFLNYQWLRIIIPNRSLVITALRIVDTAG